MVKKVSEIAKILGGDVEGDGSVLIEGLADIERAQEGQLAFVRGQRYTKWMDLTQASALVVFRDGPPSDKPVIRVDHPDLAFVKAVTLFRPEPILPPSGIHETVVVGHDVTLGQDASIGAYAVIGDRVKIDDGVIIHPGVVIGNDCTIGSSSILYANVTVREGTTIGKNVIIHCGTVIGSDGFGYVQDQGAHHKIPQIGRVVIEDDVEIGANAAVDRATLGETRIKQGTKLDNLIHVAHNVTVGQNVIMAGQVGVSGSTEIGDGVMIAGQVGFVDHIKVGSNTMIGAQSGVSKSLPADSIYLGSPARPISEEKRILASQSKLPELMKLVRDQQKRIEVLEKKLGVEPTAPQVPSKCEEAE
jgi:UDP-3-O-[3-hydroxymyristoyl] glucosamine N-acyltransferase